MKNLLKYTGLTLGAVALAVCMLYLPGLSQGSGYNAAQTATFSAVSTGQGVFENGLTKYHQLIWTTSGTVSTCQVSLDTSPDNITYTVGGAITAQTCTSNGSSAIVGIVSANYVRVNVSTLSGGGTITIVYEGWNYNPAGVGAQGTVNTGTTGAEAFYPANGNTVGPDPGLLSNGAGTITAGAVGVGTGIFSANGSTSGNVTWTCNAANCSSWQTASPLILNAAGGMSLKHFNQVAATNFAGQCTMSAATTCTATIASTYTTPLCFTNVNNAAPTTFQGSCSLSGTTVTVTASAANSNQWNFIVMGNPN